VLSANNGENTLECSPGEIRTLTKHTKYAFLPVKLGGELTSSRTVLMDIRKQ
jgi:hypothetical protein